MLKKNVGLADGVLAFFLLIFLQYLITVITEIRDMTAPVMMHIETPGPVKNNKQ